jgi:hypothetical protein
LVFFSFTLRAHSTASRRVISGRPDTLFQEVGSDHAIEKKTAEIPRNSRQPISVRAASK